VRLRVLEHLAWIHRPGQGVSADLADGWLDEATMSVTVRAPGTAAVACDLEAGPPGWLSEGPFAVIATVDPADFSTVGVVIGVARPLAQAGIGILTLSSWDTAFTLVPQERLDAAVDALQLAGHEIDR
jgi:hypothetical protein